MYTQTEAQEIIETFIEVTQSDKKKREINFEKYQAFVLDGEQWLNYEKPEGNKPCLTFNQSEDHINTFLSKLFPREMNTGTMKIGVKISGTEKEKYEKEILQIYRKNKFESLVLEQGQNFLVGGDGCFYYPKDPITNEAKIISLNPAKIYLNWNGKELLQFGFEDEITLADVKTTKNQNWVISAIMSFLKNETENTKKFKKVKRFTYWDKNCQIIQINNSFKITQNEDELIPFSWIPNQPKANTHEGISEAKKLYGIEKEFNQRASDFALRVKRNTQPILAGYTDKNMSALEDEEIKGVLNFNQGDKAEFLNLTENKELLDYLEMLSNKMANKMAINEAVQGSVKSNVSGLSMVYFFSPLMDRIALKRVFWDEAFRELNNAILTYKFGKKKYDTDPVYEPIVLTDIKTKIENTILLLENKLISHTDAIDELRGSENASEKLEEIMQDTKKFEELKPKEDTFIL